MFKVYYFENNQAPPSSFNWLGAVAIFISCISILCALYFIYLTKRIELRKSKFEKFCIIPLDKTFEGLDAIFDKTSSVSDDKQSITNGFLDVQLLLLPLQKIYNKIPVNKIVFIIEQFTDNIYNANVDIKAVDLKSEYLSTKILLYNELFKFAVTREMSLFKRKSS